MHIWQLWMQLEWLLAKSRIKLMIRCVNLSMKVLNQLLNFLVYGPLADTEDNKNLGDIQISTTETIKCPESPKMTTYMCRDTLNHTSTGSLENHTN